LVEIRNHHVQKYFPTQKIRKEKIQTVCIKEILPSMIDSIVCGNPRNGSFNNFLVIWNEEAWY